MTKLLVVESPTKIKKLESYLPPGFIVDSCVGHIRDLPGSKSEIPAAIKGEPWADLGVNVDDGFQPHYVTIRGKGKVIEGLRKKLKMADELWLATDEDREGEAIGWHLVEALKPTVPVKRMVFNEITKHAIEEAVAAPRELNLDLVQAQETRRIVDRLYGYTLSPLLWKKIGGNLSAGRVQSVAVRLVVMRERERRAFVQGSYWDLTAHLEQGDAFDARLIDLGGRRIATGKDFDKDTGSITEGKDVLLLEEAAAKELQGRLQDAPWTVAAVQHQQKRARPAPPFITSTFQQEANNRLNLSARRSMDIAQRLYQNGLITYMRTDSTALSEEGVQGARAAVEAEFGASYLPTSARKYQGKKAKGAQEAHEAIRPAGEDFAHPDRAGLTGKEKEVYRMIWQRTLACQMRDEEYTATTVRLEALEAGFQANGKRVDFPGFRAAYPSSRDDDRQLPDLDEGDAPTCMGVQAEGHETKPPARFTEATLVRALEQEGIGRPSTYASILDTIKRRGYVIAKGKALVPSFTAFAVTQILEANFPRLVDTAFTATMEETLDLIASGEADWVPFLTAFYAGEDGIANDVASHMDGIDPEAARRVELGDLPFDVRIGRHGPYLQGQVDGEEARASIPVDMTPDELDADEGLRLLRTRVEGPASIGTDPATGLPITVREGPYGPYYQLGDGEDGGKPKRASLPKGRTASDADLDEAVFLLSLPRDLGEHPTGGRVVAALGRFGPFVCHEPSGDGKKDYRSLGSMEDLRNVDLDGALALLAQPKGGRRGPKVLKELGEHPDGGTVQLLDGRYGPYVKHGKVNASIPKDKDAADIEMADALELLAARAARRK